MSTYIMVPTGKKVAPAYT